MNVDTTHEFGLTIYMYLYVASARRHQTRVLRLIRLIIYTTTEAYSIGYGMGERRVCVCVFRLIHSYYNNLYGRLYKFKGDVERLFLTNPTACYYRPYTHTHSAVHHVNGKQTGRACVCECVKSKFVVNTIAGARYTS